jgi:methionine aminopeptidase type I
MKEFIKPGVTTKFLDEEAGRYIVSQGGIPSCLNYDGFPANICVSVNDEVVHGIGSSKELKEGDIVTLDICTLYKGYHSDSAWSYPVGKINKEKEHLLHHTEKALFTGLKELKAGVPLGNCSARIQQYAEKHGLGVIRELVGHGVGHNLHEDPDVPNFGKYNTGMILNIAFNYGGKDEIVNAVKSMIKDKAIISKENIDKYLYTNESGNVDLLIRTSGEQRISNFLLWQIAYAEFYFTKVHWPDFSKKELNKAIEAYQNRDRRFGGLKNEKEK